MSYQIDNLDDLRGYYAAWFTEFANFVLNAPIRVWRRKWRLVRRWLIKLTSFPSEKKEDPGGTTTKETDYASLRFGSD